MDYKIVTATGEKLGIVTRKLEKSVSAYIAKGYKTVGEAKIVTYNPGTTNYDKFAMVQTIIKE